MKLHLLIAISISCAMCLSLSPASAETQTHWYKGNTHTHTLWSDGNDFPEMVVDWYHKNGYDFLALSDHNVLSEGERWMPISKVTKRVRGDDRDVMGKYRKRFGDEWVEFRTVDGIEEVRLKTLVEFRPQFEQDGRFLLIQAEEVSDRFEKKPIHLNSINIEKLISPQHGDSVRETIRNNLLAAKEQEEATGRPILSHLNHPNYKWAVTAEDIAHVLEENYVEVYNGHPGVNHLGDRHHVGNERIWDIANTIRVAELNARPLYGLATDDAHRYHGGDAPPGRGWIMVRAEALDSDTLIRAMRRGDFYASTGVTLRDIQFDAEAGTLSIEIEPNGDVIFTTQFIGTRTSYDKTSETAQDDEGNPLEATRVYSESVGQILAEETGTSVTYRFKGDELYVRATITSSKPHLRPSFEGQREQAWTQPVGWRGHVQAEKADPPVAPSAMAPAASDP